MEHRGRSGGGGPSVAKHRAPETDAAEFEAATSAIADVTGDYTLDIAHTRIGIRARHAMVTTVRGSFTAFDGRAHPAAATPWARCASLPTHTATSDTQVPDRDAHLRSADFLDVERYPEIRFIST